MAAMLTEMVHRLARRVIRVGQEWRHYDGEAVVIMAIEDEGPYPITIQWADGTSGAESLSGLIRDYTMRGEAWLGVVELLLAEGRATANELGDANALILTYPIFETVTASSPWARKRANHLNKYLGRKI